MQFDIPNHEDSPFAQPNWQPQTKKSNHLLVPLLAAIAAIVITGVTLLLVNALSGRSHEQITQAPYCTGYCTTHDLEKSIKETGQERLDKRLGYGRVTDVMCVFERHLHYRCSVDLTAGGDQDTETLNVTVSPDHQRWISN